MLTASGVRPALDSGAIKEGAVTSKLGNITLNDLAPKFRLLTRPSANPSKRHREVPLFLGMLMFLACMGVQARAQKLDQSSIAISPGRGLPFAIADLDGDHRPDFARVEGGGSDSRYASYWIQLQLSTIGRQYLV